MNTPLMCEPFLLSKVNCPKKYGLLKADNSRQLGASLDVRADAAP